MASIYKAIVIDCCSDSEGIFNGVMCASINHTTPTFITVYGRMNSDDTDQAIVDTENMSQYLDAALVATTIAKIHGIPVINNVPEAFRV